MNATTAKPIQSGLTFLAAAMLYLAALVHFGWPLGVKIVAMLVGPLVGALGLRLVYDWLTGTLQQSWERRFQAMAEAEDDPKLKLDTAIRLGYWFIGVCEVFWAAVILLPTPATWVPRDTTVTDWLITHVVAIVVAYSFYRTVPGKFGWNITLTMFGAVVASLGIANEIPNVIANFAR